MNITRASEIQNRLRKKLEIIPLGKKIKTIAGVDAAFREDRILGAACLFNFPELEFLEEGWGSPPTWGSLEMCRQSVAPSPDWSAFIMNRE